MAAAHYPGGLRPHPPGLRPGPRPSSEMPGQGDAGGLQGRPLLAGRVTGTAEPPPRSRAPPASQAMTLKRHPRPGRGTRGQSRGLPDEEMPAPSQEARVTTRSDQADIRTAQLDRCSIKQETEIGKSQDLRCALPGVSWAQAPNPDNRIWGESSLHQTRGVPIPARRASARRAHGASAPAWSHPGRTLAPATQCEVTVCAAQGGAGPATVAWRAHGGRAGPGVRRGPGRPAGRGGAGWLCGPGPGGS